MRIAIDIDSTLHHHWDVLSEVSVRRFGVELPYDEQVSWGRTRLRDDQFAICVEESHSETRILAATPYAGAVETIARWHEDGHVIHVVSDRGEDKRGATERWLQRIGVPYERLHCCPQKVDRCVEHRIGLLIDDNPTDLRSAAERGLAVAAVLHPWNEEVCEEEGLLAAADWAHLRAALEPVLAHRGDRHQRRSGPGESGASAQGARQLGALAR
ncbi:MAG: hypothetical protein ACYCUM_13190 [Solirubrobacteraceae bacterium]